jgi:hypothetical protein
MSEHAFGGALEDGITDAPERAIPCPLRLDDGDVAKPLPSASWVTCPCVSRNCGAERTEV